MMKMSANVVDMPPMPPMPTKPESDTELVARLQRGDDSAFEAIVRTHSGRLLSVARRFLGNNEDAQDAVQDAFIRAYKAIHTFEARAQLHTWLHRILVNTALMKLRDRRRRPTESIEDLLPTYNTDGHQAVASRDWSDAVLERKETAAIVREAERGERIAVGAYEDALDGLLPPSVRDLIESQCADVRHSPNRVHAFLAAL